MFYQSPSCQYAIGMVIVSSYLTSIMSSQILNKSRRDQEEKIDRGKQQISEEQQMIQNLLYLEYLYTFTFLGELILNLFANWLRPFFNDGWNVFDFIVVLTSLVALVIPTLPAVGILRLIRVFKV
jgi:hypothetical protein